MCTKARGLAGVPPAGAEAAAMHGRTTRSPASAGETFGIRSQLPGGNRSRAQNGRHNGRKQCSFADLSHHGFEAPFLKKPNECSLLQGRTTTCYFADTVLMHLPTTDPGGIAQAQLGVLQGTLMLQLPPQAPSALASVRNCRAENVPAHRTATAMTASNRFWIFFFMA